MAEPNGIHPDAAQIQNRLNNPGNQINGNNDGEPVLLTLNVEPLKYIGKLRTFSGKKEELPNFIKQVDLVAPYMQRYDQNSQEIFITAIRAKFIDKAQQVLDMHPHLITWNEIKALLISNFSSFKSIEQLYEDLRAIRFKGDVLEFYNEIQRTLGLLNQKCIQNDEQHHIDGNIRTALRSFKNNMAEPMKTILAARNPNTLDGALNILTEGGYLKRKNNDPGFDGVQKNKNNNQNQQKSNSQSKANTSNNNGASNNNKYHQQNYYQNRNNNQSKNFNNNQSTQYRQREQTRAEPMEVDPSSQTRRAHNYLENDQYQDNSQNDSQNAHNYLENDQDQNDSQNESNVIDTIQNFPLLALDEIYHT